ncbi:MAG TPA: hypothetical protein VNS63_17120 [Blastocatellia bacterium]|nr:hypothetical protein [Blastocatellia bacterium]
MERRRFLTRLTAASGAAFSFFSGRVEARASSQPGPEATAPESWPRPARLSSFSLFPTADRGMAARWVWEGYGLERPNQYDTVHAFCQALVREWERYRSAYVWRTAIGGTRDVWVLPARFVIAHPPYRPDFPNGYYWIDPSLEADDAVSSIHPGAFFRILPAETVDEYPPPAGRRATQNE